MEMKTCNIAIGGEAGQGIATIGELLSKLLVRSGYNISVTQSYQSRIRGGHNTFYIRTGSGVVEAPKESIDLLLALNEETIGIHTGKVGPDGVIVADSSFGSKDDKTLEVPYGDLAEEQHVNTAVLGVACALLGLEKKRALDLIRERFGKKHPEQVDSNLETLSKSFEWAEGSGRGSIRMQAAQSEPDSKLMISGNQAIALGAVSAGVRFCSFYPMTPATSVPLTLIASAEKAGLVVEQVEDEISAINMAVGASYAGAPAMVATSGGGFALMVEGLSLAGMTETPIVLVIAQRPGPATGLPTRTEQGDLGFVVHAGHGEFPRAVFAPGSVEECFDLTRKAFFLAEEFQSPVFVLTDQYLADSYRAVQPFDVSGLEQVRAGSAEVPDEGVYLRHAVTKSGISPRLLPGAGKSLVVTDSDEHTEDGHLTEDLDVRMVQADKRLRKGAGIASKVIKPLCEGEGSPDILFVSWGSSLGPVREAARVLGERSGKGGKGAKAEKVSVLHFSQVWPLVPDMFTGLLEKAKRVISVEGNATAQFAGLIAKESGFIIREHISRYDGLPLTPEYILRKFEGLPGAADEEKKKGKGRKGGSSC